MAYFPSLSNLIKYWYLPCVLFCFYCLYTLIADSYEVVYLTRNGSDPVEFLACVDLSNVFPNQTEIELKGLRGAMINYFNREVVDSEKYLDFKYRRGFEVIMKRTKSSDILVFNRRICLITNDQQELIDSYRFLFLQKAVLFAIRRDTLDFVQIDIPLVHVNQLIVLKNGIGNLDCDQNNSRFRCLNDCFRRSFRLSRYFYDSNETGRILLHFSESNRTIQESERKCFPLCKKENCKLISLILSKYNYFVKAKTEIFEAHPVLSAFDFWLQIVGLIFSFVGLFFDRFASIAIKLTKKLTESRVRQKKVMITLFYLNLTIIILGLAYCGYLCILVVLDSETEVNDQSEKEMTRNLIQQKLVHLAICVDLGKVEMFENMTMSQAEMKTDGALDDALEGIHVNDGGRSFPTDYQVHRKVLFLFYGRCFRLSIQTNYSILLLKPKLTVRLKKNSTVGYWFYVLSEEENFSGRSFWYSEYAFQKRIVKRLRGSCIDYKAKYGNCTGRQNCVERCIARKFIERYNRTTFGNWYHPLAIERDWFSSFEWNTSQLMEIQDEDKSPYVNVSRECREEIPDEIPCDKTEFKETAQIRQPDLQTIEIDLHFDVVNSFEELPYSLRMALELLSIQSIFFGFTLLKLIWSIYEFLQSERRMRKAKVVWFIVCLLCSLGCSWDTVRMLNVIVNGELVPIEHYEIAQRVKMPAIVFCFRIDQKLVDKNHKLTGRYLEECTKEMNVKSTFENITYLNESNEWTPFDLCRVERFFFLNMKCFRFHIDHEYDRNQLHFSDDKQVLRVNFKKMKGKRIVHFMTQSRETGELSKILNLGYSLNFKNSIRHESSLYEYKDRFSFFRGHYPLLSEGDVTDLHKQLLELQGKAPKRTLNLPLEEEHFELEVDERHFEQLYSAQRQSNPNIRSNLNGQQRFVSNDLRTDEYSESGWSSRIDFSFQLVFMRRIMHLTNEVNYATLTLSLLNLLSIWLEIGAFDLRPLLTSFNKNVLVYIYLYLPVYLLRKIIKCWFFFGRLLKKLANRLVVLTTRQPQSSPVT